MLTVTAVYKDGVLLPSTKLDLPNDTKVKVQIIALSAATPPTATAFGSLAGIWSHVSDADVAHMQQTIRNRRQQSSDKVQRLARDLD